MSIFVTVGTRKYVREIAPNGNLINMDEFVSSLSIDGETEPWMESYQSSFFVLCNGKKINTNCILETGKSYDFVPRLLGGKGGFGSMLRAIGAQIEKTTSREACRDLSGRRMRDINNEKMMKEWVAKEPDRKQEREERKQERLAKMAAKPQHKFDDAQYHKQHSKAQEDLEDALEKGLKRSKKSDKSESSDAGPSKKSRLTTPKELLGMDIDSDDLQSDSDMEADPGSSGETSKTEMLPSSSSSDSPHNISSSAENIDEPISIKKETDLTLSIENDHHHKDDKKENSTDGIKIEPAVKKEEIDSNEPIDLENYGSSSELSALGLERLKNALMSRSLKCGGTLEERAGRLFSVKGLAPEQIDPSLYAKSKGKGKKSK